MRAGLGAQHVRNDEAAIPTSGKLLQPGCYATIHNRQRRAYRGPFAV